MRLNIEQANLVDRIEKEVCTYFGVSTQEIINRDRRETVVTAREFIFFMLHFRLKVSSKQLSRIYCRTPRNIIRCYSNMRAKIKFHQCYKTMNDEILQKIEPLLPKDIERFMSTPENKPI